MSGERGQFPLIVFLHGYGERSQRLIFSAGVPRAVRYRFDGRVKDNQFFVQLLRAEGKVLGRYDARFSGLRYEPGTDQNDEYDPSDEAVNGPLSAAFNDYIRRELKFESDLPYELVADVQP